MKSLLATILVLSLAAPAVADIDTSPGKNSAFRSVSGAGSVDSTLVTIAKGKPKRVLKIDFTVTTSILALSGTYSDATVHADVNGVQAEGALISHTCTDASDGADPFCTVSGTTFLDLDAAEEANPGEFKKQPLEVTLYWDFINLSLTPLVDVILAAEMVKK